ncbi:acyl-CoA reductase [Streptomyces mirabilis]
MSGKRDAWAIAICRSRNHRRVERAAQSRVRDRGQRTFQVVAVGLGRLRYGPVRARIFGGSDVLDGWVEHTDPNGRRRRVRAFPPRLVHMLAGNSRSAAMTSIADAALVKAVNVFTMPSVDPFTTVAVLRTMADIAPDHPVLRSMSAVYWRGGDERVEGGCCTAPSSSTNWSRGAARPSRTPPPSRATTSAHSPYGSTASGSNGSTPPPGSAASTRTTSWTTAAPRSRHRSRSRGITIAEH